MPFNTAAPSGAMRCSRGELIQCAWGSPITTALIARSRPRGRPRRRSTRGYLIGYKSQGYYACRPHLNNTCSTGGASEYGRPRSTGGRCSHSTASSTPTCSPHSSGSWGRRRAGGRLRRITRSNDHSCRRRRPPRSDRRVWC